MKYIDLAKRYLNARQDADAILFCVLQGGIVRKKETYISADKPLDIDLTIAYKSRSQIIQKECVQKHNDNYAEMFEGVMIDVRFMILDEVRPVKEWKERVRYIWTRETIFVCGDKDMYDKFVKEAAMTPLEQEELYLATTIHIQTKGIWPRKEHDLAELAIDKTEERKTYWERKGYPIYGRIMKMRAFEYIEQMIFTLNGCFTPSPKYREYIIDHELEWVPDSYHNMIEEYVHGGESLDVQMNKVVLECIHRAESMGLTGNDPYHYTFKTSLDSIRNENRF